MTTSFVKRASLAVAAGAVVGTAGAADPTAVEELITRIKSKDENVRTQAWLTAGKVGVPAIRPLTETMICEDREAALAARRALGQIVVNAGRPGAGDEAKAVAAELVAQLRDDRPLQVRREVVWLVSEIGGDDAVGAVASLLGNGELREDARCSLQRIPGEKSLAALRTALESSPEEFRPALAAALRARGVAVSGYPSQKLVPTRPTAVKPVGR